MNAGYLIARSARYFPEKTAFVIDGQAVTFLDLNNRVNKLANGLLALGLKKGDRVGLLFHNSYGYLESYLALYKAGMVWVRLNARLAPSEQKAMLDDSEARALIHGGEFTGAVQTFKKGLEWVIQKGEGPGLNYDELQEKSRAVEPAVDVTLDDLSDLWYTSGTTGAPKGIMLTHRNIMTCTQFLLTDVYDLSEDDQFMTPGALSHAGSVRILPFILRGATCHLQSHFDAGRMLIETEEFNITDWALVPTMLVAIMDHPDFEKYDLSSLKRITYAGSPLPVERIKEAIEKFGLILDQSYGQAESIITITHLPRREHDVSGDPAREGRLASAGREYPGVRIKIIDDEGKVLGPGETGEVITRSDLVMNGYWKLPDKTRETIVDGWLHTGDIGYMDEAGYLYLVDRKHDKIITGGLNVFPREVEEVMATHPAIAQVAVFGVKDSFWGEAVTAAVVLRQGATLTEDDLKGFNKQHLGGYKRPKTIHFMDDLPKNLYGKVLRKDLKEQFQQ